MNELYKYVEAYKTLVEYNGMCKNLPMFFDEKTQNEMYNNVLQSRSLYIQACSKLSSSCLFSVPSKNDVEMSCIYEAENKKLG